MSKIVILRLIIPAILFAIFYLFCGAMDALVRVYIFGMKETEQPWLSVWLALDYWRLFAIPTTAGAAVAVYVLRRRDMLSKLALLVISMAAAAVLAVQITQTTIPTLIADALTRAIGGGLLGYSLSYALLGLICVCVTVLITDRLSYIRVDN